MRMLRSHASLDHVAFLNAHIWSCSQTTVLWTSMSQSTRHLCYRKGSTNHRVNLFSLSKPFAVSHYRSKKESTAYKGPAYSLLTNYNTNLMTQIALVHRWPIFSNTLAEVCTYTLSNQQLQKRIFRPSSTPDGPPLDRVIADQYFYK